jgi:hypothetical protein
MTPNQRIDKIYLLNFSAIATVIASVLIMFFVQFSVENLQEKLVRTESQIVTYKNEIRLLEVEWAYLTRPERLRDLASRYLTTTNATVSHQVKNFDKLQRFYEANYRKASGAELAMIEQ